jgi:hypothetical protein
MGYGDALALDVARAGVNFQLHAAHLMVHTQVIVTLIATASDVLFDSLIATGR